MDFPAGLERLNSHVEDTLALLGMRNEYKANVQRINSSRYQEGE